MVERYTHDEIHGRTSVTGFPPTVKKGNKTYYFVGGSLIYFGNDFRSIKKNLKKESIRFIVVPNKWTNSGMLIYPDTQNIHLANYTDQWFENKTKSAKKKSYRSGD